MTGKLYIAAASAELERAERLRNRAIRAGWTITHDWMAIIREHGSAAPAEGAAFLRQCAIRDLQGIYEADRMVVLVPRGANRTTGAWTELGYAQGLRALRMPQTGKPHLVASVEAEDYFRRNIFLTLVERIVFDDDETLNPTLFAETL